MLPVESIPSPVTQACAGLALGLLFPLALGLYFHISQTNTDISH
jgi:hypothetical protein